MKNINALTLTIGLDSTWPEEVITGLLAVSPNKAWWGFYLFICRETVEQVLLSGFSLNVKLREGSGAGESAGRGEVALSRRQEAMELTGGRAQWLLCSGAELHFSTQTNNVTAPVRTNSTELSESSVA